jgi:hypothetical protein
MVNVEMLKGEARKLSFEVPGMWDSGPAAGRHVWVWIPKAGWGNWHLLSVAWVEDFELDPTSDESETSLCSSGTSL